MTKKLFALLVAACVLLSAMTIVLAEEAGTPTDVVTYTLTFEANVDATRGSMDPITLDAPGKATIPALGFKQENMDFTGWNTVSDGSGIAYAEGDEIMVDGEITLYAQWIRKGVELVEYTVTYDANGGEGETIDEFNPYIEGLTAMIVYNNFTRAGYDFVEWNTAADGSGTPYAPDDLLDITGDVVLYAIWESNGTLPEEPAEEKPAEDVVVEDVVTETEADDDAIPGTGDASVVAVATGVCAAVAAAFVVLKKKN